ncbi:MAG TPA: UDP-N-acetylmuramoyl-tripeptide--D-alanyl-D-alanine ligase [Planctomycetota bacterium]|nr:UDP-N-acetylmuramoyl-tripeptide--D-alanyl-D-alanine ligase [Planctomycetota bacterium]
MIQESFTSLAHAARGKILHGKPDLLIRGHFTDTRAPVRGGLYVALRGDNFDGNRFAREAVERHGAAAVLVDSEEAAKELPENASAILVDDSREAFLSIAAVHREKLSSCLWIGVTGSVGKSTTKEILAHILSVAKPARRVHKAKGSFNNAVGLSKTILEIPTDASVAVLEIGTNHPGEIAQLSAAARPQIAVITCAAESHLEAFDTIENVAREKAAILKFQEASDTAVLNADDPFFELWQQAAFGSVLSFGLSERADIRATNIKIDDYGCARFDLAYKPAKTSVVCKLHMPGAHQVSNVLAAIGAALAAGVRLDNAAAAAETFEGVERRFAIHRAGGVTLIDDAYNANPASFRAALATLATLSAKRRFVVAGGMLELGAQSEAQHRELGASLARMNLAGLTVVGELAATIGKSAMSGGMHPFAINFLHTPEEAAITLAQILRRGDAVLIKGSHGIQLDHCVGRLLQSFKK